MTNLIQVLALLFVLIASPTGAQVVQQLTSNPTGDATGWTHLHWASSVNKILVAYGHGSNPIGNNSVQLFDPLTNTWSTIFANNNGGAGAPANRDNHLSFYNSNRDEFWVYGGTFPAGTYIRSGRFGPIGASPTWLATSTTDAGAFTGIIKNFGGGGSDSGVAWSHGCNCGVIFSGNDSALRRMWIIEPNTAGGKCATSGTGSEPYNMCEKLESGTWPSGLRGQCSHCLTSDANGNFYLVGGSEDISTHLNTVYKWNYTTGLWTQLANVPAVGYTSSTTYDTDLGLVLNRGDSFLSIYDVATNVWAPFNSLATDACIWNAAGIYAPTVKKHIYMYGQECGTGHTTLGPVLAGVSPSGAYLFSKLLIAPGLWVYRPFSALPAGIMGKDTQSVKHMSLALNRTNGRVYNFGGDWGVLNGNPIADPSPHVEQSARNEIWSFDPISNTAVLEYSYCGTSGDITVARPTEVGAVWDGTNFWVLPGYEAQGNPANNYGVPPNVSVWPCNTATQALPVNAILKFNPGTQKFTQPTVAAEPCCSGQQLPKNGRYDSANNSIWRIGLNAGGNLIEQYFIGSNTWQSYQMVCAADPYGQGTPQGCGAGYAKVNDNGMDFEHFALDPVGRKIYVMDPKHYRFIAIDIAGCVNNVSCPATIAKRPPIVNPAFINCLAFPDNTGTNTCAGGRNLSDFTHLEFDSVNSKVLYPFLPTPAPPAGCNTAVSPTDCGASEGLAGYPKLVVYDPPTDSWTVDQSLTDVPNVRVRGNSFVFDPDRNFLVSYGGCIPNGCGDNSPGMTGYWLYRLGGTAPVSSIATLTVNSVNPASGVPITITDNTGTSTVLTPFSRPYAPGSATAVTMIAPATLGKGGNPLSDFTGCDSRTTTFVTNDTCHATMTANKTVAPVYTSPAENRDLLITSTPTGIPMTISPADVNGNSNCAATPCPRVYPDGTAVMVTAPLMSGINSYTLWTGDWSSISGPTATVTMNANKAVQAPYVSGTTYQNSVDFSSVDGQRGWRYRDSVGAMTWNSNKWEGPETFLYHLPGGLSHPGTSRDSVLRWIPPVAGDYRVTGTVRKANIGGGDGVVATIKLGGATFFTATIPNGNTDGFPFDFTVTMTTSNFLDFITNRRTEQSFDTTDWSTLKIVPFVAPVTSTVTVGGGTKFGPGAVIGR